ncbi:MAG: sulfatase-like hydrolase/transferase, partial [Kiritimatiellae bacterium]|nr:sulfatase-like hydrolase/transferase [Kiritimatiellia bacterium]
FLTGRYPRTARNRQNGADIPDTEVLVTRMLADAGYTCGLSGKLHLSACNPAVCKTMERRINDGYSEFHWSHDTGTGWGDHNEYVAWLTEKGATLETPTHPECEHVCTGMPADRHQTTWCAEKAIDFMKKRADDEKPWLFSVNIFDPHHAFDPPPEYLARYVDDLDAIPLPNYVEGELNNKPPVQKKDHQGAYGNAGSLAHDTMTEHDHRMIRAAYWAMCDLIDDQVGRMLAALDEHGMRENTIVIFNSDHGEMLGDHGIYLKGPYFYDCAVRVPLIMSMPATIKAQRVQALVELIDLPQTLLDACGIDHHPGMQGKSLWPILTGKSESHHRDDVYCEYYNAMACHKEPTSQFTMVRTAQHKLVVDHGNNTGELYDLEKDPSENTNLWDDPTYAETKTAMLLRMAHRMAFTVDPLPLRQSYW